MTKILFSDDNELLFEDFKDRAYKMGIDLHCVTNWEDAQEKLESNWAEYDGLILDGKGKLDESATGNDSKHLSRSLGWLNQQFAKGHLIPTVVYSAYIGSGAGNLEDHIDGEQPFLLGIFNKDKDVEVVLECIQNFNTNLPVNRLKLQYQDVLTLFDDKRMPENMEQAMIEVLKDLSLPTVNKTNYNKIRDIIESMLKMANNIDKVFIPDVLLNPTQNNRPNLKYSELYLTGREVRIGATTVPRVSTIMIDHIGWIYSSIVNCCQIFSHNTTQKHTQYAYKSTVFGLLEVLLWYKDYLTNKYGI